MASFQVDATPVEDVITEPESTTNAVAPPPRPPETVKSVDAEDDKDPEDLTAPPYEEKVENSEDEEERDVEYSPFVEGGDEPPSWYAVGVGEPAATFNEHDENAEDDDDF